LLSDGTCNAGLPLKLFPCSYRVTHNERVETKRVLRENYLMYRNCKQKPHERKLLKVYFGMLTIARNVHLSAKYRD